MRAEPIFWTFITWKKVENLDQEKNLTDRCQSIYFDDSLNSIITKTFLERIEIQHKLDNEEEIKRTPGRPSNFKYMKSNDLKQWIFNLFAKKLFNLLFNKTKEVRIDLFTTEYFRIIRKIPHYIVQNFWTKINFRSPDLSISVVGLVEAFSAYSFAQNNFDISNIVERVVDFSLVYFSEEKCMRIINELMRTSDLKLQSILSDKIKILQIRRKCSAKFMKEFVRHSSTMRELFTIALQVLSHFLEPKFGIEEIYQIQNYQSKSSANTVCTRSKTTKNQKKFISKINKADFVTDSGLTRVKYLYKKTKKILNC